MTELIGSTNGVLAFRKPGSLLAVKMEIAQAALQSWKLVPYYRSRA